MFCESEMFVCRGGRIAAAFALVCLCAGIACGASGTGAAPAAVETPVFDPPGGVYANELSVKLSCKTRGATIYYTTDGGEPTTNSTVYTGPIKVSENTRLKARAFAAERPASDIGAAVYVLLDDDLRDFSSNLPLVVLNTFGALLVDDYKRPAYMTILAPQKGRTRLEGKPHFQGLADVELRGSTSRRYPKRSMGFVLRDETTHSNRDFGLLGMPPESHWVLYAPYPDKSLIRDVLGYDLWAAMGHYSVRSRYVEMFVCRQAKRLSRENYVGVYVLLEKIRRGPNRVNIAKLGPDDNSEPTISGGYIIKKDRLDRNDNPFTTSLGHTLGIEYPKGEKLTAAQKQWINRWFNEFEAALMGPDYADPAKGYARYIDVDSFIDYYWIVEMPKTIDGFAYSMFMQKDRNGKLAISAIWDWNFSFGNANYNGGSETDGWYWPNLGPEHYPWYGRLFTDPNFKQKHIDRWAELRRGVFATSNLMARIDAYTNLLHEAQAREFERWPRLGRYVWANADADWPNTTYAGTIQYMKNFLRLRLKWIDSQFTPAPELGASDGAVPRDFMLPIKSEHPVYYTLDGTDPRLPGGGVNPAAIEYKEPVKITGPVKVFARARKDDQWSAPAKATLTIGRRH